MAKSLRHQQQKRKQHQNHKRHFPHYFTLSLLTCSAMILLLCGNASANGNTNITGNHNYTIETNTFPMEHRSRRALIIAEMEKQQPTLVPNAYVESGEIKKKKPTMMSQSNDNSFRELNIKKRAPNGFVGMRGKKNTLEDDEDDYKSNAIDWNIDPLYQGKATSADGIENDYSEGISIENTPRYKKAPTAFYGVRGKKLPNLENHSNLNSMLRELQQERLREQMLQDFIGRLATATAKQNEIIKRAPTGFTGLRGKRPAYDWNTHDENMEFMAEEAAKKRVPTNFVGVRGKKDVDNQSEMEQEHQSLFKRSPAESFGGNGKRRNVEFQNKFVAVRGKKDMNSAEASSYNVQRLRYLMNSMPALVYGGVGNLKRAPSGFIGMRGKRTINTANEAPFSNSAD